MSNWTHVAGIIRIDSMRYFENDLNFDDIFGKECLFESSEETWNELYKYPERFLPSGSEGTLQKSVWINKNKSFCAAYTVSIFGDLRDHDNPQEIIDWFERLINENDLWVRNAVITVENEWNGTMTWTWMGD